MGLGSQASNVGRVELDLEPENVNTEAMVRSDSCSSPGTQARLTNEMV